MPAAVEVALRTSVVPLTTLAMVALAGMPDPTMLIPAARPVVLATVTVVEENEIFELLGTETAWLSVKVLPATAVMVVPSGIPLPVMEEPTPAREPSRTTKVAESLVAPDDVLDAPVTPFVSWPKPPPKLR